MQARPILWQPHPIRESRLKLCCNALVFDIRIIRDGVAAMFGARLRAFL